MLKFENECLLLKYVFVSKIKEKPIGRDGVLKILFNKDQ